jgi:glycolate oxidase FAD binding subunit
MNEWGGQPLPLTATCYREGRLYARLAGAESAVAAGSRQIGGTTLADSAAFWASLRDQRHEFFGTESPQLWRLSVRSTAPYTDLGGSQLIEWGGSLRWLKANAQTDAARLRAWARQHGGHAALFSGEDKSAGAFQPLDEPMLAIHRRLKATMDPAGILNRRRMFADF